MRVEEDFGQGYVRLKSSEADRRQAAQDIRSSEDVVLEMLRNSRDAGASHIFIATHKEGDIRTIVVIDDGCGIPPEMHELIFLPRVTSKLDSAKADRWGYHGRGMALFSIKENVESIFVCDSSSGIGSAIKAKLDSTHLSEKADQSTFPRFELVDGVHVMRGPKNILRTVSEFAIENRTEIEIYCGSPTEIACALYEYGKRSLTPSNRVFHQADCNRSLTLLPSMSLEAKELSECASRLGLDISERSARRIMNGEIDHLPSMIERIEHESFAGSENASTHSERRGGDNSSNNLASAVFSKARISQTDINDLAVAASDIFGVIAEKYYLRRCDPSITQKGGKLTIQFDLIDEE